eukprot:gnl/MRDRNA2_/MRDRNA2_31803_c0_seq1.p1 gnl/MRDRNA2_/MRDRNA2_31803_c0~~gnl/MRDRNA2_/MRDRNA2_31803_c0_seq1.p1  ORF type:complete len:882 (+),score=131.99 gnl/MRDRNA2_/MRDRNA2_31803_c0_seq1:194-2839(+)
MTNFDCSRCVLVPQSQHPAGGNILPPTSHPAPGPPTSLEDVWKLVAALDGKDRAEISRRLEDLELKGFQGDNGTDHMNGGMNGADSNKIGITEGDQKPLANGRVAPIVSSARSKSGQAKRQPSFPTDDPSISIVQFSTGTYYCAEEESTIEIDIVRLGNCTGKCVLDWSTEDASAKAGKKYVAANGRIEFAAGDSVKKVGINILSDDSWDATLEFKVVLSNPSDCSLGKYLDNCRIKILDDDSFPTNKFKEQLQHGQCEEIAFWPLMMQYIEMNIKDRVVEWGTWKTILTDQMKNVIFIFNIHLSRYLVDQVLSEKGQARPQDMLVPNNADLTLWCLALARIIPFFFIHLIDFRKCYWKVGGTSRKRLQSNLIRKFLNYDHTSRSQVKESDLIMAIARDSPNVVTDCYIRFFVLVKSAGSVTMLIIYQSLQGKALAILPVAAFPILMLLFLACRSKKSARVNDAVNDAQNKLVQETDHVITRYQLYADYNCRPQAVDAMEAVINKVNGAITARAAVHVNNKYFAPWLRDIILCLWIVFGGHWVLVGNIKLGEYLATASIFSAVGGGFLQIYETILVMSACAPSLYNIVWLMNLAVDVEPRMKINREKRKLGENMRQHEREEALKAAGGMSKSLVPADRVPLKFIDVGFSYGVSNSGQAPPIVALSGSNCQISQGRMVCIVGPRSQGKSTFLKLLGGVLLPQQGTIFTPPWLRVLHVSQEPVFFEGTLLNNLVIGVNADDVEDSDPQRVLRIVERLGLQNRIVDKIASKTVENWDEVLSRTQKLLLSVARALVANPEVLVMHSPAVHLDRTNAEKVFTLLREFVDKKGLEQDPRGWRQRRPRTCVITSNRIDGVQLADHILLCQNKVVKEIRKDTVGEEMLM